jgi:DNA-directed RNA polymerase subunit RPC12/RpoP
MANITETPESNDTQAEQTTQQDSMPQFFGDVKDVVARYTHCALCGSNLHFNHITDFTKNMTQEIARCPECGVKARQVMHKLQ